MREVEYIKNKTKVLEFYYCIIYFFFVMAYARLKKVQLVCTVDSIHWVWNYDHINMTAS